MTRNPIDPAPHAGPQSDIPLGAGAAPRSPVMTAGSAGTALDKATGRPAQPGERGYQPGCGCCCGPENDRCCCQMHADLPRGLQPKTCTLHGHAALLAELDAALGKAAEAGECAVFYANKLNRAGDLIRAAEAERDEERVCRKAAEAAETKWMAEAARLREALDGLLEATDGAVDCSSDEPGANPLVDRYVKAEAAARAALAKGGA